jgi:hypothetical protein
MGTGPKAFDVFFYHEKEYVDSLVCRISDQKKNKKERKGALSNLEQGSLDTKAAARKQLLTL